MKSKINRFAAETGGTSYYIDNAPDLREDLHRHPERAPLAVRPRLLPRRRREDRQQMARGDGADGRREGEDDSGVLPVTSNLTPSV